MIRERRLRGTPTQRGHQVVEGAGRADMVRRSRGRDADLETGLLVDDHEMLHLARTVDERMEHRRPALALLAPGARVEDFVLVSNHSDGEIRSVGFVQMFDGKRVVGGQVSFRFKRDRLIAIGSEALPDVVVDTTKTRMSRAAMGPRAKSSLRTAVQLPLAPAGEAPADNENPR